MLLKLFGLACVVFFWVAFFTSGTLYWLIPAVWTTFMMFTNGGGGGFLDKYDDDSGDF